MTRDLVLDPPIKTDYALYADGDVDLSDFATFAVNYTGAQ